MVLKEPPPRVLFSNFGADALEFELEYWLDIGEADSVLVASDLRHMIDGALAKPASNCPFRSAMLHLQQDEPLQIEVRRGPSGRAADSFKRLFDFDRAPCNMHAIWGDLNLARD